MANRLDTDVIQLRKIYARTSTNEFIPSSHVLVAGGDGSTYWNSVNSLIPTSFHSVKGNTSDVYYPDLSNSLLKISTTGIQGTLNSYVDPLTSTLMLSNAFPPFIVSNGSVPNVNTLMASNVPNAINLTQTSAQSSIKFLGVGDVKFSTITSQNAIFVSISTFTSVGYSTLSGETFAWRPALYSTFSTAYGRQSFISSIPFSAGWNYGSNLPISIPNNSRDMYFSSITFNLSNITPHIDLSATSSTRLFIEYNPILIMPPLFQGTGSPIFEVSTFIQSGPNILTGSCLTNYMVSQQFTGGSNYFNPSLRIEINPYTTTLGNNLTLCHRFVGAISDGSATGFSNISQITNFTSKQGGLFVNLINQSPQFN